LQKLRDYQIAFASFMLTLSQNEFQSFCELAKYKCSEPVHSLAEHSKCIILQIPAQGVFILLTKNEGARLCEIHYSIRSYKKSGCLCY
jgi:hypothetical protein